MLGEGMRDEDVGVVGGAEVGGHGLFLPVVTCQWPESRARTWL